ncbi:MAG: prolyl oligopeptidase family serine peptidase [Verrucomicrobiae bacterium]|nr:prolyl oligopeptidase family serine peptidase [Verrucomicrobiae bacterium]
MNRFLLIFLATVGVAFSAETRSWTSADGTKSFEGEMLEFSETEVRIKRKADFTTFVLPLEKLSEQDQAFIQGLLREKKRDTALKDGPYAEKITGQFEPAESANGLKYQLFGNPRWKGTERTPLLIWLHGAGQSGDDNKAQMGGATKAFGSEESQEEYPCFILAPQCPSRDVGWKDSVETNLMALIADLVENLPIDESRIYLTGSSMGGFGSWRIATNHPDTFAAVVPICGGGNPSEAETLKVIPIWAFHGDKDDQVPVEKSREMFQAIQAVGGELVKYDELPGEGHLIAGGVYAREDLAPWIFAQKRPAKGGGESRP